MKPGERSRRRRGFGFRRCCLPPRQKHRAANADRTEFEPCEIDMRAGVEAEPSTWNERAFRHSRRPSNTSRKAGGRGPEVGHGARQRLFLLSRDHARRANHGRGEHERTDVHPFLALRRAAQYFRIRWDTALRCAADMVDRRRRRRRGPPPLSSLAAARAGAFTARRPPHLPAQTSAGYFELPISALTVLRGGVVSTHMISGDGGDLGIWRFEDLKIWRFGDLEIWRFGDLKI
jgi:hypothetical protein